MERGNYLHGGHCRLEVGWDTDVEQVFGYRGMIVRDAVSSCIGNGGQHVLF